MDHVGHQHRRGQTHHRRLGDRPAQGVRRLAGRRREPSVNLKAPCLYEKGETVMRLRSFITLGLLLCSGAALADRQPGWDFGGELLYQFSQDIDFEGGSDASLEDDVGIAL